jgi:hypothetical protein
VEAFVGSRVGFSLGRLMFLMALFTACSSLDIRPVDYQIDILDVQPDDVAQVRLCVREVVRNTQGARELAPSYFLSGSGNVVSLPLVVELLDENKVLLAQAEVPELKSYVTTSLNSCQNDQCETCKAPEANSQYGDKTWALAVRFQY